MYITNDFLDPETNRQKTMLYEHSIQFSSIESNQLFGPINLDSACGDVILASPNLLIVACKASK
jgi:hypothetical protein